MNLKNGEMFRDEEHNAVRFVGINDGKYSFQLFESANILDIGEKDIESFVGGFNKITRQEWKYTIVAKDCWKNKEKMAGLFGGVPSYEKMYIIISEVQDTNYVNMMYEELEKLQVMNLAQMKQEWSEDDLEPVQHELDSK